MTTYTFGFGFLNHLSDVSFSPIVLHDGCLKLHGAQCIVWVFIDITMAHTWIGIAMWLLALCTVLVLEEFCGVFLSSKSIIRQRRQRGMAT